MTQRIELKPDEPLQPGEVVELHYKVGGPQFWKATIAAAIEEKLSGRKEFTLRTIDYQQEGKMIFTCVVNKTNPIIVTVAVIAAAIVAVGIITWMVFDKAYKVIDTPTAQNFSWAAIIIAGIVLVTFLRTGLKK